MEILEVKIIITALIECKPRFWIRYVDDIIVIIKKGQAQTLKDHMSTADPYETIKLTTEEEDDNGLSFLDTHFTKKDGWLYQVYSAQKKVPLISI